ncbi:FAD-binding protein [Pseudonocardia sp. GCM10023141]|uniref:FAD-binding protein n=1 Tax=Pseudonocardia sp. GCM10023141 TaxID=3252653 RepID=UPI00361BC9B0
MITTFPFDDLPPLDGSVRGDPATLADYTQDAGHVVVRAPAAVLCPGSVADVQAMMRFCRRRRIPVVARGLGNTTGGQSLTSGLVVDCRTLDTVEIESGRAIVGSGATWLDVARAARPHNLAIPAATGYLALTIGGTLSVGGVPPAFRAGAQIDHVLELDVVTGDGELHRCSDTQEPALFEAVLGGLGRLGVITRAVVALIPAPGRVRGHSRTYTDRATFFADLRTLLDRCEITEAYGEWCRPGEPTGTTHLSTFTFHDASAPPEDGHLLRGLSGVPDAVTDDDYLDHVTRIDDAVDGLRDGLGWAERMKPWLTVWLPDSQVDGYVGEVVDGLVARDVGPGGFVLLYVHRRAALTRPSLRLPAPDGSEWVYLFTLMTSGPHTGTDPQFAADMLGRNRRLFERARSRGGVRYPIETVAFSPGDWRDHFGTRWAHLEQLRRRHDPAGILGP